MPSKPPMPRLPGGLLLSELVPGVVYRCRLSHLAVLVERALPITGPHTGNPKDETTLVRLRGLYYNPVYGVHQRMELVDHLLTKVPGVPAEN